MKVVSGEYQLTFNGKELMLEEIAFVCVCLINSLIFVVLYRLSAMKHWQGSFRVSQNHKGDSGCQMSDVRFMIRPYDAK